MSGMDECALCGFLDDEFGGAKNFSIKVSRAPSRAHSRMDQADRVFTELAK